MVREFNLSDITFLKFLKTCFMALYMGELYNIPCVLEKRVCPLTVEFRVLYITIKLWFWFKFSVTILIFYLIDLSIIEACFYLLTCYQILAWGFLAEGTLELDLAGQAEVK